MSEEIQAQVEEVKQETVAPAPQEDASKNALPEEVTQRTKEEFEKLLQANKELKQALKEKDQAPEKKDVLESLRPAAPVVPENLSTAQVEEITKGLTDESGYVDVDVLNKVLKESSAAAAAAQQQAQAALQQLQRYEETRMVQEAYKEFPELDPFGDKYDEAFWKLVRNEVAVQMMSGPVDLVTAAKTVSELTGLRKKEQESGKTSNPALEARAQVSSQEVASDSASTSSQLKKLTTHSDREVANKAIAERLKAIGI